MGRKSYIDEDGEALELDAQWFAEAKRGRPVMPSGKPQKRVSIRLDADVLEYYRDMGGHFWQEHINEALCKTLK